MLKCCNFGCSNTPTRNRVRCGKCRQKGVFLCLDCGCEHSMERALRCVSCRDKNYIKIAKVSQERYLNSKRDDKWCKNCGCILPSARSRYCGEKCQKEAISDRLKKRRKRSDCKVCGKNLMGTVKHSYCSDGCKLKSRTDYMVKFNIKRRKTIHLDNCVFCAKKLIGSQMFKCASRVCFKQYNNQWNHMKRKIKREALIKNRE
jgi:hypothetical protein